MLGSDSRNPPPPQHSHTDTSLTPGRRWVIDYVCGTWPDLEHGATRQPNARLTARRQEHMITHDILPHILQAN